MNKAPFLFLLFLLNFIQSSSQKKESSVLLVNYLNQLENQFHVKFSAASITTKDVFINKPTKAITLENTLLYLNQYTSLNFKKLNKRYITITPKKEFIEYLNPVVLRTYITNGIQKKQDGSIVLNTKKFDILPGLTHVDILQSIQTLPGIESENENINYINVRGGTNDQNLILWEGIKMYHSSHFFGLISAYNVNFIDRVNIVKNGTSSLFGDGISSTINLSTSNKIATKLTGGFGLNLISTDAYIKIPVSEKLQVNIGLRKSINDIKRTRTYNNYFYKSFQDSDIKTENNQQINSSFSFYDITSKVIYKLNNRNKLQFNFINIKNQLEYEENKNDLNNSKTSKLDQQKTAFGLNWVTKWSLRFNTNFKIYHTNYNINSFDETKLLNQFITQKNKVIENNIKIENQLNINSHLNLNFGIQLNESAVLNTTNINNPFFNRIQKKVAITNSLFSEIEYNKHNTYIKTGFRANYLNPFNKLIIEPRFILKQKLISHLKFKILGEFKHQTVNQTVDFKDHFLGVENRRWVLSNNKNIPIVKSKQLSYGLEFYKNNFLIEITSFYKSVKGVTAASQGFYNNFQSTQDYGSYKTYGTEILINKTGKKYNTWFAYTLSNNNYLFKNFDPKTFPNNVNIKHSSNIGINYTIYKNLKISMGLNWKRGNVFTKPVKNKEIIKINGINTLNYDSPNKENLSNYFRLDSSIKYNFTFAKKTTGSFSVGVLNLTNRKNIVQRYYKLNNNQVIETNNQSLKFTPNASFRVNF